MQESRVKSQESEIHSYTINPLGIHDTGPCCYRCVCGRRRPVFKGRAVGVVGSKKPPSVIMGYSKKWCIGRSRVVHPKNPHRLRSRKDTAPMGSCTNVTQKIFTPMQGAGGRRAEPDSPDNAEADQHDAEAPQPPPDHADEGDEVLSPSSLSPDGKTEKRFFGFFSSSSDSTRGSQRI